MPARIAVLALRRYEVSPQNKHVPGSALSQWLVGIDVDSGPDGCSSPTFLKQNFDVQEAADLYQAVHLHTLEDLAENDP